MWIIHGTWIPRDSSHFKNGGDFFVWVEKVPEINLNNSVKSHPNCLSAQELAGFFQNTFSVNEKVRQQFSACAPPYFLLPSAQNAPLPSSEMFQFLGDLPPEHFKIKKWQVDCILAEKPLAFLKEIHFVSLHASGKIRLGSDLLFWYCYWCAFREIILKDQYIPGLKAHPSAENTKKFEIVPNWQIISPRFESILTSFAPSMPLICRAGQSGLKKNKSFFEAESLLRHFSECVLDSLVLQTPFTQQQNRGVADSLLELCIAPVGKTRIARQSKLWKSTFEKWFRWKKQLETSNTNTPFVLCFRLNSDSEDEGHSWQLDFLVESRKDPSLKVHLSQYWQLQGKEKVNFTKFFGKEFDKNFLLLMGAAARIYPKLWQGLQTEKPDGILLSMEEAYAFLKEKAWILEDAGYRVMVPAWWTPDGRRRARLRMKVKGISPPGQTAPGGHFNLPTLVRYEYRLSIGDEEITEDEWEALINAKMPLVRFRGQWMELDQEKMGEMLSFWQSRQQETELALSDLIKRVAEKEQDVEFEYDPVLSEMMSSLQQKREFSLLDAPSNFLGELREYQQRGLSWLCFLESLKMGPCLADDMGLGKTVQIIALLLHERQHGGSPDPTLLIAPTSVLGNWQKEIERFGPELKTFIHHGSQRPGKAQAFQSECAQADVVITSFALARIDAKLFHFCPWHRIVVDEAQNIKNPNATQTRAILKIKSRHRIALTGTPIENRLLDLWSIFNFLNPGYLNSQNKFKAFYEIPIQRDNDADRLKIFKKLVEPFILRRVKTDKAIIKDLPEKVEQKVYCPLGKEQASLYQSVVDEVKEALEEVEGIQRKGLILSTLMKLKQICNHPAQFLKDGSEFSEARSHKLGRLLEMANEILENGESLLLFTQFNEVGQELEKLFRSEKHIKTWYLHGATSRQKREAMISEFQDIETDPGIFVLSLKAGGVGITLTKANHVFHFDRWWNPAVENQATDRAFRIGQKRNVFVHKFVTPGTLEERIDAMLEDKKKLSESVVGGDESWLTELDDQAFRQLIELNRNSVME
ncbi:MAG: DEAD/DEAH box helicase [SAR324 cluster bacterium]|nr:DEAD/DEAH box helicase [SAR324 cluster bacterium]